ERNLAIIPVINKIDLPTADVDAVMQQLEETLAVQRGDVIPCSAKAGIGIEDILERIVTHVPAPQLAEEASLKALVFDSHFDNFRGIMVYIRLFAGEIRKGSQILLMGTNCSYDIIEVGVFTPQQKPVELLRAGEVGYFVANIKNT